MLSSVLYWILSIFITKTSLQTPQQPQQQPPQQPQVPKQPQQESPRAQQTKNPKAERSTEELPKPQQPYPQQQQTTGVSQIQYIVFNYIILSILYDICYILAHILCKFLFVLFLIILFVYVLFCTYFVFL